jgi:putative acetyltransferase
MLLRPETAADVPAIRSLIDEAFSDAPHSSGTEAEIVDRLRADGALTLSLLAVEAEILLGHVAFSPVTIGGQAGWLGLGPLAVRSDRRGRGIGARLVRAGLEQLERQGAEGCVLLGDPAYYGRFGFAADPAIMLAGVPQQYVQLLRFTGRQPRGEILYHPAFGAA